MKQRTFLAGLTVLILLSACGRSARVSAPPTGTSAPTETASVITENTPEVDEVAPPVAGRPAPEAGARFEDGRASWYGDPYHGRRAASGEVFDKNKLTAAHRTLPFDTWVRVENQTNGRMVDVRINDRGPFVEGRIIDLSEAAAREIDMIRAGVVPVRVTVLQEPDIARRAPPGDVFYVVQLGAFRDAANARRLVRTLSSKYTGMYVEYPPPDGTLHRVLIGRAVLTDATRVQDRLRSEDGIESIVVQVQAQVAD